jgi:hypothetical protein
MTDWERWAIMDPIGAGMDLACEAIDDSGLSAAQLYDEGCEGWYLSPCLDAVRERILEAALSELWRAARAERTAR